MRKYPINGKLLAGSKLISRIYLDTFQKSQSSVNYKIVTRVEKKVSQKRTGAKADCPTMATYINFVYRRE